MNINEFLAKHEQEINEQVNDANAVVKFLQDMGSDIIVPDLLDAMAVVGVKFVSASALGDTTITVTSAAYTTSLLQKIKEN